VKTTPFAGRAPDTRDGTPGCTNRVAAPVPAGSSNPVTELLETAVRDAIGEMRTNVSERRYWPKHVAIPAAGKPAAG